jgi:hypothetical protein
MADWFDTVLPSQSYTGIGTLPGWTLPSQQYSGIGTLPSALPSVPLPTSSGGSNDSSFAAYSGLAQAGTGLLGALIQANAVKSAAATQAATSQASLDFLKSQKAKQEAVAAPYLALGDFATTQLPFLAARSPFETGAPTGAAPVAPAAPTASLPAVPPAADPISRGLAQLQRPTAATRTEVTLRAPDGTRRNFRITDPLVEKALVMGAEPV